MRCGAKRYQATFTLDGKKVSKPIIARTAAEARKSVRKTYGKDVDIDSVIEER